MIAIERRAFPTPWSLAMFVLELSKPSGICLAALEDGVIIGYLVCSRYDTVWHLMNVAVEPQRQRQGIATTLLERLFEQADKPSEQYTLEVRTSNDAAIRLYERFGFRAAGRRRALLPRQPRGRAHHVADGRRSAPRLDPRARDELRRHLRGRRDARTAGSPRT